MLPVCLQGLKRTFDILCFDIAAYQLFDAMRLGFSSIWDHFLQKLDHLTILLGLIKYIYQMIMIFVVIQVTLILFQNIACIFKTIIPLINRDKVGDCSVDRTTFWITREYLHKTFFCFF